MYTTIVCSNTGNKYTVTDRGNYYEGNVAPVQFFKVDEEGHLSRSDYKSEYIFTKAEVKKAPIYKREFLSPVKDRYDYAFTERVTRSYTTEKDVYYNAQKDKFISKGRRSYASRTEYNIPSIIIF